MCLHYIRISDMSSQIYTIISFLMFISISIFHLFTLMRNTSSFKGITKGFLMPLLLLFYCVTADDISILIIAALLFSFIGDVGLFVAKNHSIVYQRSSILSFALSHVCYALYILLKCTSSPSYPHRRHRSITHIR